MKTIYVVPYLGQNPFSWLVWLTNQITALQI